MSNVYLELGLPTGTWQVAEYGAMTRMPNSAIAHGIEVIFFRIDMEGPPPSHRAAARSIPLAHMPALPVGRLVQGCDGKLLDVQPLPGGERRSLLLDLGGEGTGMITLRRKLSAAQFAPDETAERETSSLNFLAREERTRAPVYIPCTTLFQYYWGQSSAMVDAVLTGKFLSPDRYVRNPANSFETPDGEVHLELRKQWPDQDAALLATILSDHSALEEASAIYKRLIQAGQAGRSGERPHLQVWPPFPRRTMVEGFVYYGRTREFQRPDKTILTYIERTDLKPRWTRLTYTRENDRGESDAADTPRDGDATQPGGQTADPDHLRAVADGPVELSQDPVGYGPGGLGIVVKSDLQDRFPGIAAKPTEKVRRQRTHHPAPKAGARPHAGKWSAMNGMRWPDSDVEQAQLVSRAAPSNIGDAADDQSGPDVDERLRQFANAFMAPPEKIRIDGQSYNVEIRFYDPVSAAALSPEQPYFELPKWARGARLAWLYRDPDRRFPKRGVCIQVRLKDAAGVVARERFAMDFEYREPRRRNEAAPRYAVRNSFLVVQSSANGVSESVLSGLHAVIDRVAADGGPADEELDVFGLAVNALRHGEFDSGRMLERICAVLPAGR